MKNTESAPKLAALLAGTQLPALPQSAIRLLELDKDPDNGPAEFAIPIETDPGLTGQVLRFVNSSYFGFSREISSIKLAITLVGVRTIKNFALWSAVFSLMPDPKCGPFRLKNLWQDSLRRALFARAVGRSLGLRESEDLFASALLQDMAVPLLAKELPQQYDELLAAREGGRKRLSHLECERFGWTHAEAAGVIARGWSLPEEFASLTEHHTHLDELLAAGNAQPGQLAVSLSAELPSAHDASWPEREHFLETFYSMTQGEVSDLATLLEQVDEQFTEFAPVVHLPLPEKPLTAIVHELSAVEA